MSYHPFWQTVQATFRRSGVSVGVFVVAVLMLCSSAWADGAALLAHRDSACYCHCAVSKARGGCVKMCETPKYASRWWAVSCARPKSKVSNNASKAGPRFPRPGRAERAAVNAPSTGVSR